MFELGQLLEASENYIGYCIKCGAERMQCEPDARGYRCERCGEDTVYGAEEIMIMGLAS